MPGLLDLFFFFSSRRRHTRFDCDWSSDVCSSDLDFVRDARRRHNQCQIKFAAQTFGNNLQVEHAEEPATKSAAQHSRRLFLKRKRRVAYTQTIECLPKR